MIKRYMGIRPDIFEDKDGNLVLYMDYEELQNENSDLKIAFFHQRIKSGELTKQNEELKEENKKLKEDYKKLEEENKILKDKITQVIQEHNSVSTSKKDDDELFKLFLENFKEE